MNLANIIVAASFSALWLLESWIPFYEEFPGGAKEKIGHDSRNLALGLINAVLTAIIVATLFPYILSGAGRGDFGLLSLVAWPAWVELAIALLLFDIWMYIWHRVNHVVPFLWRFHRMHHTEVDMDASSAVRFHPGEIFFSGLARLAIIPLIGLHLHQLVLYELILSFSVFFHHSNIRLLPKLDYGLMALIVTPAMHRVHHSRWEPETNSNYGTILSWWDKIFGSFRLRDDAHALQLGLDEFDSPRWHTIKGLMGTPLAPGGGSDSGRDSKES